MNQTYHMTQLYFLSMWIAICFTSGENEPLPMSVKFATRAAMK